MGCLGSLADLPARAVALVNAAELSQGGDGVAVETEALRLAHHLSVGVEAERRERGELVLLVAHRCRHPVEVLEADQPLSSQRGGVEPRHERGAQVAEV